MMEPTKAEVRKCVIKELADLANPPYRLGIITAGTTGDRRAAIDFLYSRGCITYPYDHQTPCVFTPAGWNYYEQVTAFGPWYWFKRNWFPATVAAATLLVGLGTLLLQAYIAVRIGTGP